MRRPNHRRLLAVFGRSGKQDNYTNSPLAPRGPVWVFSPNIAKYSLAIDFDRFIAECISDQSIYRYLYIYTSICILINVEATRKPLQFVSTSHDDLKAFPDEARRDAGFNLDFVQRGLEPENWKPMKTVGPGVKEIPRSGRDRSLSRNLFGHASGSGLCTALFPEENPENSQGGY